jgi:hypothetical protein
MKQLSTFSIVFLLVTRAACAENGLAISGDIKTGLNISKEGGGEAMAVVKNSDDAGTPGRIRLNFVLTRDNIQIKWRAQATGQSWDRFQTTLDNMFDYFYGVGDFFDHRFRMSLGKIGGDMPWETGGDEIWGNIEAISGARFEFKPQAAPGLNVGFMLPALYPDRVEAADYFRELRFGVRYENNAVDARIGLQLDGQGDDAAAAPGRWSVNLEEWDGLTPKPADTDPGEAAIGHYKTKGWNWIPATGGEQAGGVVIYRFNPKFLRDAVPGFSLWLNGRFLGLKTTDNVPDSRFNALNWLYLRYGAGDFHYALTLGFENWGGGNDRLTGLYIKPGFSWRFAPRMRTGLGCATEFFRYKDGYKIAGGEPSVFNRLIIEPSIGFDLGSGADITTVYTVILNAAGGYSANSEDSRIDNIFELRLRYGF